MLVACADEWVGELERRDFSGNPMGEKPPPQLVLQRTG